MASAEILIALGTHSGLALIDEQIFSD